MQKFGHNRFPGFKCQGLYHETFYVQAADNKFLVLSCLDLDDSLINKDLLELNDPNCFKEGRDRDQFMIPFQCDVCHFLNIKKQLLVEGNLTDDLLMMCICILNLDSMCSR